MSDAFMWGMICLAVGAIIGFMTAALCAAAKDRWDDK